MTCESLDKELKSGILASIYVLYGEEIFLLETTVKKIKRLFGDRQIGINYIELDEENFISSLMPEIQTPPFGFEKKLIIIKNSSLFKKETKKKVTGLKELRDTLVKYLKDNIEEIKQNVILVFVEESVERLNITKEVENLGGIVCEFEYQKPFEIEKRLLSLCEAYKVKAENGAIKELIEVSGTSMQELINEIRKLIEYAGENGTITKRSVELLSTKTLDSNIFELTDNLRQKKHQESS